MSDLMDAVKEAKNTLGIKGAEIIASGLNISKWDNRGLKGCCPVHRERNPSFSWNKKTNSFKCFACGTSIDIIDYYSSYLNMSFVEAAKKLFDETNTHYEFEEIRPMRNKEKEPYKYPIPEKTTDRIKVEKYMQTRGISPKTLDSRGIRQDEKGNIVFEYRNQNGELLLVKYRPSRKVAKGENKLWCQKDKDTSPLLFGMDKINPLKPLLITEGEIDSLVAIECGFTNAVSVPFGAKNYSWIESNFEWLEQFEKIIVWADNDTAGEEMKKEVVPRLGEYRCFVVSCSEKDANVLLFKKGKEAVLKAIEEAKDVPIKDIIDLSDVGEYDINKAEKIKSGLKGLDKWIVGFVVGSLDIITGVNSSGKSTLINQICVAEPLEQGYKTFIYSGELNKEQLRSWIQLPLCGPGYIQEFDNGTDVPKGYYVPKEIKKALDDWYRGNIYIYNNEDDNTAKSLLHKMVELVKKFGVKNFVLDNLMMIDLECGEYESLKKQKEFVFSLKKFARRYNAVVHLVAHPRKTDLIQRLTKMDVAGSGDITNLADYVLAIHRVTPKEKEGTINKKGDYIVQPCLFDNILDLFKNRHTGYQDKAIGLYFDVKCKRMYGESDDVNKKYGWCSTNVPDMVEVEDGICPF